LKTFAARVALPALTPVFSVTVLLYINGTTGGTTYCLSMFHLFSAKISISTDLNHDRIFHSSHYIKKAHYAGNIVKMTG
jgi:hypothetical protein